MDTDFQWYTSGYLFPISWEWMPFPIACKCIPFFYFMQMDTMSNCILVNAFFQLHANG